MHKITKKMAVLVSNAKGQPDIYFCRIVGTADDLDMGNFHLAAEMAAEERAFSEFLSNVVEEDDPAGIVMQLADWERTDTFEITREKPGNEMIILQSKRAFAYKVVVSCATQEEADMVMGSRLGHDEECGVAYSLEYERME